MLPVMSVQQKLAGVQERRGKEVIETERQQLKYKKINISSSHVAS